MRADRTVIVIGAFLFVIGLAVAWNGYGYVQLERGWTQVISGTCGACTGLVLVALGLVLRELETIASSAARATLLLAKGRNGFPTETPFTPDSSAYAPPDPPAYAPPAPPVYAPPLEETAAETIAKAPASSEPSDSRQDSPLSWMVRANRASSPLELRMPRAENSDAWLRQPLAEPTEELAHELAQKPEVLEPELPELEVLEPEFSEPEPTRRFEAPTPEPVSESAPWTPHEAPESQRGSVHEERHEPTPEHEPAPEIAPEQELELELEPETARAPEPEPIHDPAYESAFEPAVETVQETAHEPAAAEPASDEPKPEIIGHYDAQGAHYTLYADGTIEADTPHGVYRFASMAELKRFIEGQV